MVQLQYIDTEQMNPRTTRIDALSTLEMVKLINQEDKRVAKAVEEVLPDIAHSIDCIYTRMAKGGRLIYLGCGTSGRLGILDAVECPPTYGTEPEQIVGVMAGGLNAFVRAVEGAEDNAPMGEADLQKIGFSAGDVLVGIAASGRTPYVLGAMAYAKRIGALVIALTSSSDSELSHHADICIAPLTGAEVITGSTRMKSGSAQKMVLNMLSTGAMIKLGKVYGNLMVDVKATNKKLAQRAVSIVCTATGANEAQAKDALRSCDQSCKIAIVMILCGLDATSAQKAVENAQGHVRTVMLNQR